jgi:hypothetical protein
MEADEDGEAIIDAEWDIIGLSVLIMVDECDIIGVSLPIMVEECDIIGEELLEVDEAGEDEELHADRVSARATAPPAGASRASERRVSMGGKPLRGMAALAVRARPGNRCRPPGGSV